MNEKIIDSNKIFYPHANQLKVLKDQHKYRIVVAGRRFGKSSMSINYGLAWILSLEKQVVWIILPTYKSAKSIYWDDPDISGFFMPYVQSGLLKKNDSELSLKATKTQSHLILKGSDDPDKLRGSGLDLIIWDEVPYIKQESFNIITPALTDSPNHKMIYCGTPNGFDMFHDVALRGDHNGIIEQAGKNIKPDPDYITFRFTSYDNMTWPEGSVERQSFVSNIDKERIKYTELGEEDWFEQEYMASFRKRAGAVHKLFDRTMHVIPNMELPKEWARGRGWDWGSSHPTASLRIAIDNDDNWFLERSYKKKDLITSEHAANVKAQDVEFLDEQGNDPITGYGDPSGRWWILELNKQGFSIKSATHKQNTDKKTSLEISIDAINTKIAPKKGHTVFLPNGTKIENAPSFFILNTEENMQMVSELESLTYKKTNDGLQRTELEDSTDKAGHYDLHACLRYFAVSQGSAVQFTGLNLPDTSINKEFERFINADTSALKDPEKRKAAELQADLDIIKKQRGW